MTGSIRSFEKIKFHSETTYFRVPQGQTSRYDRLAQLLEHLTEKIDGFSE